MFKQFWVLAAFALRSCLSWGILALITCIPCFATTPQVTVSATSQTLLGTNDTISLTATLIDPNSTGMLRVSGAGVITTLKTSTITAGTTATLGPIWGNDVVIDGLGNLNNTYYEVQVFKVNNSIIASTPVLQNFYAFTGSGTIDLATATPVAPSFMSGTNGNVTVPGALSITGLATFSGGLTAPGGISAIGSPGTAMPQQTVNTKLGAGALHVNTFWTNQIGNSPTEFDSVGYSEQLCGTSIPASSGTGDVVQNFTFGSAASADCTRGQVLGLNSIARLAGGSWSSLSVEERSFEADVSQNSGFDAVLNSSAASGDTNQTGILAQSTGTNKPGIGVWAHSSSANNVWERGIVSDSYDTNGYAFEAKGDGAIHFLCETATASQTCAFYFNDAGTTKFTVGKNTTNDYVLFDSAQSVIRFAARNGANGNTEIRANGSGSVQFNGNVASVSSTGLVTASGGLAAAGTAAGLTGTGACASLSSESAGSWSGVVTCTGTTGASTLVITPGNTATHNFVCFGSDETSGVAGGQLGISNTTCTLKFATVTNNDSITFGVISY